MERRPYLLAETNWKEIKAQTFQLAILPWGATEAHNFHLPYGTDIFEASYIAEKAAENAWRQGAFPVVLPTIPFGVNTGQPDILLDINLNPSTQLAILRDIITVLDRQGIHKLLILNSHGGNDFKTMLRELGLSFPNMLLVTCNWFQALDKTKYFEHPGDHADEMETSIIQFLFPHLVLPLEEAGSGAAKKPKIEAFRKGWAWSERKWTRVTADTGIGDPRKSSPEKGSLYLEDLTRTMGDFIYQLSVIDKSAFYE
jgi:creatinine amidohydrolase